MKNDSDSKIISGYELYKIMLEELSLLKKIDKYFEEILCVINTNSSFKDKICNKEKFKNIMACTSLEDKITRIKLKTSDDKTFKIYRKYDEKDYYSKDDEILKDIVKKNKVLFDIVFGILEYSAKNFWIDEFNKTQEMHWSFDKYRARFYYNNNGDVNVDIYNKNKKENISYEDLLEVLKAMPINVDKIPENFRNIVESYRSKKKKNVNEIIASKKRSRVK